jgi:tetratricopeptide (TPR) repeat protein
MPEVEATALETAGLAALAVGRPDRAAVLLERNLVAAQSIGEQRRIALACLHLAKAVGRQRAVELLDRAITLFRGLRTPDEVNVAKATQWRGRTSGDVESLAGALALFERLDRSFDAAQVLEDLGAVQMRAGDPAAALDYYRRARENYERQGFLSHAVLTQQRLTELV